MRVRPVVRQNDFSPLAPPDPGTWTPSETVSVVIPARDAPHLDLVLAALAAQTYPAHLLEVLVVDDGGALVRLPELRPDNTRIVRPSSGWGISNAVNTGVRQAEGELIQRLDADMIACRTHLEALARWHTTAEFVVAIGRKLFVEPDPLTPQDVHAAHDLGELFDLERAVPSSTEATIARTDGLRKSRNPYHVCTGPTVSLRREVFDAVGGLDPHVLRGEDTEFAYRLAMHGVVFVPDEQALAVHLGLPTQHRDRERAVRAVEPYLAHRIPLRRDLRKDRGRSYLVPYVEIVYDVAGADHETVRQAVSAALDGTLHDVVVTLVGPWSKVSDERHPVLDDPLFDLRHLRDLYAHDQRVRLIDEAARTPAPIPFRYRGPLEVPLHRVTLERMIETAQQDLSGVLVVDLPDGRPARLERTSALGRVLLLGGLPDETIEQTHGIRHEPPARYWPATKPATPKPGVTEPAALKPATPDAPQPSAPEPATPEGERHRPAGQSPSLLGKLRSALRQN